MNPLLLGSLALGGGLLGGLGGALLLQPAPTPSSAPGSAALELEPEEAPDLEAQQRRIRQLESEVSSLQVALSVLEARMTERREEIVAAVDEPGEFGAGSPEIAGGLAGSPQLMEGLVDARVQEILEARDEEEAEERERAMAEMRDRRVSAQLDRLRRELNLDDFQSVEMKRILVGTDQKRLDFFMKMRESGQWDRDLMRDSLETIRSEARDEVALVLTPSQLEGYDGIMTDNRGWGGGPPRGGFRGLRDDDPPRDGR